MQKSNLEKIQARLNAEKQQEIEKVERQKKVNEHEREAGNPDPIDESVTVSDLVNVAQFSAKCKDLKEALVLYSRLCRLDNFAQAKGNTIAGAVYDTAKLCQLAFLSGDTVNFKAAHGEFLAQLEKAETWIISSAAGIDRLEEKKVKHKSQGPYPAAVRKALRAFEYGLDLREYPSLHAIEVKTRAIDKAAKEAAEAEAMEERKKAGGPVGLVDSSDDNDDHGNVTNVIVPEEAKRLIDQLNANLLDLIEVTDNSKEVMELLSSFAKKSGSMLEHLLSNVADLKEVS